MLGPLLLVSFGWAANLALPAGERAADWAPALEVAGLTLGPGGVVVEGGATWRLRYASAGGERTATVSAPRNAEEREQVAIVAASLMRQSRERATRASALPAAAPPSVPSAAASSAAPAPRRAPRAPSASPAPEAPPVVAAASAPPASAAPAPEGPAEAEAPFMAMSGPEAPSRVAPAAAAEPGSPLAERAPSAAGPAIAPPEAASLAKAAPPAVRVSAAVGAVGVLRPGLGANPGGAVAARVARGAGWIEAGGQAFAATQFEAGSLALSTLALRGGARVEPLEGWGCFAGAGVVAERWEVVDLAGARAAAGFGVEAAVGMDRALWGPVALELTLQGGWDAQSLVIDALPEAPSRFTGGVALGLRVGA